MTDLIWHNEKRVINDLLPYEKNPRQMTDKQAEDLKCSLKKFNLVEIPAIDTDNVIIAGHQRLKIMQLLGRGNEIIDVRVPNRKLTQKEFEEYLLRSNKNIGEWNFNILTNDFDIDFLHEVGFINEELNFNFDNNAKKEIIDSEKYLQKFSIIIECENEEQQEQLYHQLSEQGLKCKILSI